MQKQEILNIIEKRDWFTYVKKHDVKKIFDFLNYFKDNFIMILDEYEKSSVDFSDYYNDEFIGEQLTEFFKEKYEGKEFDEQYNNFILYSIFKKINYLLAGLEICEEGILDFLSKIIDDLNVLIDKFYLLNNVSENELKGNIILK